MALALEVCPAGRITKKYEAKAKATAPTMLSQGSTRIMRMRPYMPSR